MADRKKWFFLMNNEVSGPFHENEIEPLAKQNPTGLIWGHGFQEWVGHLEWKNALTSLSDVLNSLHSDMRTTWSLKHGEQVLGPFTYDGLIQTLKAHSNPGETLLKHDPDHPEWKGIYEFPALVEEVGITRRQHNRVPVSGLFKYEKNGLTQDCLLTSISQGGLGVIEGQGLSVGDQLKGQVQSPQLSTSFNCTCEVLYQQPDGNWGLRFVNLPIEAQTVIISYTKKFTTNAN